MDNLSKDVQNLMWDIEVIIAKTEHTKSDIDRGINTNTLRDDEGNLRTKVGNLVEYLTDAYHDVDSIRDELKQVREKLELLVEEIEYEKVAQKVRVNP